jgi:uncharacterized DUF497 family protein
LTVAFNGNTICWTDRATAEEQVTRIISARLATNHERESYVEKINER